MTKHVTKLANSIVGRNSRISLSLRNIIKQDLTVAVTCAVNDSFESNITPRFRVISSVVPYVMLCCIVFLIVASSHIDSKDSSQGFGKNGYFCPQCWSKYCDLPVECVVCGLTLVSAPHLARSYHHLFPLQPFAEISTADIYRPNRLCYSCQKHLSETHAYECSQCSYAFCIDCDVFIHEILHCCPGCASKRTPQL